MTFARAARAAFEATCGVFSLAEADFPRENDEFPRADEVFPRVKGG